MSGTTLLALVAPAVAIVIAFWGFRRTTRADRLAAFFTLHEQYLKPEVRAGRRLIHNHISGRSPAEMAELPDSDRATVGFTLATLNAVAIACEARYVDRIVVQQSMGRSFAAAVTAAKPYIDELEARRGFRPYGYAERLAARIARERTQTGSSLVRGRVQVVAPPETDEDAEPDHVGSA
jgi:hypothetical protein